MPIDRRSFVFQLGAVTGGLLSPRLLGGATRQALSPFQWRKLDARTWVAARGGGNTTVFLEPGGAIVVDTKLSGMGSVLARDIAKRFGHVQAVIATHHHDDHTGGLSAFPDARLIAHAKAVPRVQQTITRLTEGARLARRRVIDDIFDSLAKDLEVKRTAALEAGVNAFLDALTAEPPPRTAPNELVADGHELRFGDTTLRILHHGPGHTDNDIAIFDAGRRMLIAGDLLFHRFHPFVDVSAGASTTGWQAFLRKISAECPGAVRVIAGHGDDTDLDGLAAQGAYFEQLRDLARAARRAGQTRERFLTTANDAFGSFGFADLWKENLGVVFDELAAAEAPNPR